MTVRMVLLADTHWPRRAKELPTAVWDAVDGADVVVHAGDWVDVRLLDALEERSGRLLACWGNNDGPELRGRLPEVARDVVAGLRVAVVHETGPAAGRERRMDERFDDADLLVFGHSHIPWDSVTPGGLRLLNPGSPTDRRRQPSCTFMTVEVQEEVREVQQTTAGPPRLSVALHAVQRWQPPAGSAGGATGSRSVPG